MRDIIYRGLDKHDVWHYGHIYSNTNFGMHPITTEWWIRETDRYSRQQCFKVAEESIGIYFGQSDNDGKRIFENDILAAWHDDDVFKHKSGKDVIDLYSLKRVLARWFGPDYPAFDLGHTVKVKSGKTAWVTLGDELNTFTLDDWNYRVIGNTSQNPDLLKGI